MAGILAMPAAGAPPGLALRVLAFVAVSTVAALALGRMAPRRAPLIFIPLTLLDLAAETAIIVMTGTARSPFVLLYSLTIAVGGLGMGLAGGVAASLVAAFAYWMGAVGLGREPGVAPLLTVVLLGLLGLFAGLLGRRAAERDREVARVRGELERAELDAERIVESLAQPLICLDARGRIRRANHPAVDLLGLRSHPEGLTLEVAGDPRRLEPILERMDAALKTGTAMVDVAEIPGAGTPPVPVEVALSPMRDGTGSVCGVVLLVTDQTRRREQELEQARRERLAVVGELAGHLAHEIRNSLKPLVGSLEMLAGDIPPTPANEELLGIVRRESESLEAFLTDFLAFARDKCLTMEVFDLDLLLREEAAAVRRHPSRRADVAVECDAACEGLLIRSDREAIRGIVRNLMVNALEATEQGRVAMLRSAEGEDVTVLIEDTGEGLPDCDAESLFEPFCTHKPGGTGLGLAISRRLARRLGGEIHLERRDEGGTRALLRLMGAASALRAA